MKTLDVDDGRIASRFRPDYDVEIIPSIAGLCAKCRREMWTNLPPSERAGHVIVSTDGQHCNPCRRYTLTTGNDPRNRLGSAAERVPAEMAETDESWRADPSRMLCSSIGPSPVFDPNPMRDEPDPRPVEVREGLPALRRSTALKVCSVCPVMWQCREAALDRGYEGLWGARFYTRGSWHDYETGASGPTRFTDAYHRDRLVASLKRRGLDEHGEPLDDDGRVAVA